MKLREKLRVCQKYIRENGYPDATIERANDGTEMVIFRLPNMTAKYPNEHPSVTVSFAKSMMNGGENDFDVMQVMCFISTGVPSDRLADIEKFCSDFDKAMQVGHFGVDYRNEGVYFKCSQVTNREISADALVQTFDSIFAMVLFYFGYAFEILLELSYGIIGYGGTAARMRERRRMLSEAMRELSGEQDEADEASEEKTPERNMVVEELLAELKKSNPEILEQANINVAQAERRARGRHVTKKQAEAEETAMKIMDLAQTEQKNNMRATQKIDVSPAVAAALEEDGRVVNQKAEPAVPRSVKARAKDDAEEIWNKAATRQTERDSDYSPTRSQMPSIEMFAKREERKPEPPLDMESLRKALQSDHEERERRLSGRGDAATEAQTGAKDVQAPAEDTGKGKSSDSLVQRLRKWTNS